MTSETHTPWGIEETRDNIWIGPMKANGNKVGDVVVRLDYGEGFTAETNARIEANARLIAAAPTMHDYIQRKAAQGDAEAISILEGIHANS